MKLTLLVLILPYLGFAQQDSIWAKAEMNPPAITSVNAVSYNSMDQGIVNFENLNVTRSDKNEYLIKTWFNRENTSSNKLQILSTNGELVTVNHSTQKSAATVFPLYQDLFKYGDSYVQVTEFQADGYSDSVYVFYPNKTLKESFAINTHEIQNVFLENDKLIFVSNGLTSQSSFLLVYDLTGTLIKEEPIGFWISESNYQNNELIVCGREGGSIKVYSNQLDFIVGFTVGFYADYSFGNGFVIAHSAEKNVHYNLNTKIVKNLNPAIDQVITDPKSETFYVRLGNTLEEYDANLVKDTVLELPGLSSPGKSLMEVEFKNPYFLVTQTFVGDFYNRMYFVLNKNGDVLYQEQVRYADNAEPMNFATIETDPAGHVLFFSPNGLTKVKASGEILWHRDKPFVKRIYLKPQLFMNEDGSFMVLANYNLWNAVAILFENDESRCRYSVNNPIPEKACAPSNQVKHQYISSFTGNLTGIQLLQGNSALPSVDLPYNSLGLSFNWYKDGHLDSTNYLYTPDPGHTYLLEIAQPGCSNKSEPVHFSYGNNDELLSPKLTAKDDRVAIGNSTYLIGSCDNALVSFQQLPPNMTPNMDQDELMVTPESTTTYSMTCQRNLRPLVYSSQDGYKLGEPVLSCETSVKEVQVIVYDPNAVLSKTSEAPEIKLFPNPSTRYFQVLNKEGEKLIRLEILNSLGQLVHSYRENEIPESQRIDLSTTIYKPAVYLVRMSFSKNIRTLKLVIQ